MRPKTYRGRIIRHARMFLETACAHKAGSLEGGIDIRRKTDKERIAAGLLPNN